MKLYITYHKKSFTEQQIQELNQGGGTNLFGRYF